MITDDQINEWFTNGYATRESYEIAFAIFKQAKEAEGE